MPENVIFLTHAVSFSCQPVFPDYCLMKTRDVLWRKITAFSWAALPTFSSEEYPHHFILWAIILLALGEGGLTHASTHSDCMGNLLAPSSTTYNWLSYMCMWLQRVMWNVCIHMFLVTLLVQGLHMRHIYWQSCLISTHELISIYGLYVLFEGYICCFTYMVIAW